MSARSPSPGKALVTMDLPKAVHALMFDRHGGMTVQKEKDGIRIRFSESGGSVEILLDEATLDGLLALIAEAKTQG